MEPQGGRRIPSFRVTKRSTKLCRLSKTTRSRVHVQTVGLECRDKKVSAPSRRGRMSLDIPFYRTRPRSAFIRHYSLLEVFRCRVGGLKVRLCTRICRDPHFRLLSEER